jgi:hypothetical protein
VAGSDALSRSRLVALVDELTRVNAERAARIEEQAGRIAELTELVAAQAERIVELERRLGQNSKNPALPPSSDRFGYRKPRSGRGKTDRSRASSRARRVRRCGRSVIRTRNLRRLDELCGLTDWRGRCVEAPAGHCAVFSELASQSRMQEPALGPRESTRRSQRVTRTSVGSKRSM